ncbi:5-methylcytosine-specific restriction endonuclease system specificity protein McrC [Alkalibacterium psychrotolerans]
MLTYYFDGLNSKAYEKVTGESFDTAFELLAELLIIGTKQQVKRGLHKGYKEEEDITSTVRGSIQIVRSIRERTLIHKKVAIQYDEYSADIIYNQILKTTLYQLLRNKKEVTKEQQQSIRSLLPFFSDSSLIPLRDIDWQEMIFHRNNKRYELLMNICYFVIEELLMSEESGNSLQEIFERERLSTLYEKFLLNFYKKHHSDCYKVHSPHINWAIADSSQENRLPRMETDVVLENKNEVIIIDAKFYKDGAFSNKIGNSYTHRSNNLYQMYAYMNNWEQTKPFKKIRGILVYAQPDESTIVSDSHVISGKKLDIITLNLNQEWRYIEEKLHSIVSI